MTPPILSTDLKVVRFFVQQVQVCADLHAIKKVIPLTALRAVPGSPPFLAGLLNSEGQSIPVIDLALRLGVTRTEQYTLETLIMICQHQTHVAGIIVDHILGLFSLSKTALQMVAEFDHPESPIFAVAAFDAQLALVLNMEKLLTTSLTPTANNLSFDINTVHLAGFKHE